jgi:hypothetical protein
MSSRQFQFAGQCRSCDHLIQLTRDCEYNNIPDSEWIRCADCDSITRVPFVKDEEAPVDE